MNEEQKQYIVLHLNILKEALRKEGLCFAFAIDKTDFDKSSLAIVDKNTLIKTGKAVGMTIKLDELNKALI